MNKTKKMWYIVKKAYVNEDGKIVDEQNVFSCTSRRKLLQAVVLDELKNVDLEDYFITQKWSYPNNKYMDIDGTKMCLKDAYNSLIKFEFKTPTVIYTHQKS